MKETKALESIGLLLIQTEVITKSNNLGLIKVSALD